MASETLRLQRASGAMLSPLCPAPAIRLLLYFRIAAAMHHGCKRQGKSESAKQVGSAYNIFRCITMCQLKAQFEVGSLDAGGNGEQPR